MQQTQAFHIVESTNHKDIKTLSSQQSPTMFNAKCVKMIRYSAHFICDDDNDDPGKAYLWLWFLSVEQMFFYYSTLVSEGKKQRTKY